MARQVSALPTIAVCVAVFAALVGPSLAQQPIPYSYGFESGQNGWVWNWNSGNCPGASANFASTNAMRSGTKGLEVTVTTTSSTTWYAEIQSPQFNVSTSTVYQACVYVRSATPIIGTGKVPFTLVKYGTWASLATMQIQLSTTWTQYCLGWTKPSSPGMAYYTIGLAQNSGTVYVDDFSVSATTGLATPTPAAPYSFDFSSLADWWVARNTWSCPCASGTFNFGSAAAGRTGGTGLQIATTTAGPSDSSIEMWAPKMWFGAALRYQACVWVKYNGTVSGATAVLPFTLYSPSNYQTVYSVKVLATSDWTQICTGWLRPSTDVIGYFILGVGKYAGTFLIDDFTIVATDDVNWQRSVTATPNAPYAFNFEGQSNWGSLLNTWDCPCPSATMNYASAAAARSGATGLEMTVTVAARAGWHVRMQSAKIDLVPGYTYTLCLWVRSPVPINAGGQNPLILADATNNRWIAATNVVFSTNWTQACLGIVKTSAPVTTFLSLEVGTLLGTFYVDDFTLTAVADSTAQDQLYLSDAATADRITQIRTGSFSFRFIDGTTNLPVTQPLQQLNVTLARHDFPFGTAVDWYILPATMYSWHNKTVSRLFNSIVPGNSFKWVFYEPSPGVVNYNAMLKAHVKFAADNDMLMVRGHTLEWPSKCCANADHWPRKLTCDGYRAALETRIRRDVAAFRGTFKSYDVFNEIVHELEFIQNCPGMWPSILHDGFRWAREADPDAQLCLNDYGLVTSNEWQQMVQLVKGMLSAGVPINCIGIQAYISTQNRPTPAYMKPRLDALASTGLPLIISEYNFFSYWDAARGQNIYNGTEAEQVALHNEYVPFWFSLPYIKSVLLWGFWDTANWIPGSGIYRSDGSAKLAAQAIDDLWHKRWFSSFSGSGVTLSRAGDRVMTNFFYGKYQYSVTYNGKTYTGVVNMPSTGGKSQMATIVLA